MCATNGSWGSKCFNWRNGYAYRVTAGEACTGEGRRPAIHDFVALRCKVVDAAPPAGSPGQASRTMTQEGRAIAPSTRLVPRGLQVRIMSGMHAAEPCSAIAFTPAARCVAARYTGLRRIA